MKNKEDIKEIAACFALMAMVIAVAWLYCKATPSQLSGESDWTACAAQTAR